MCHFYTAGLRKTGLVALFHKFDVVSESFLLVKIGAISWKICVKTCGDILMIKIVQMRIEARRS